MRKALKNHSFCQNLQLPKCQNLAPTFWMPLSLTPLLICSCFLLTNGFLGFKSFRLSWSEMTIFQLLIPRYSWRCLPINNNLSKQNIQMSSTQLAKKIVTIGIYRYLTIYRATQFISSDILETVNCKYSQKMNDCSDLFLKCQVLILIHL